jgi:hypothetical protein
MKRRNSSAIGLYHEVTIWGPRQWGLMVKGHARHNFLDFTRLHIDPIEVRIETGNSLLLDVTLLPKTVDWGWRGHYERLAVIRPKRNCTGVNTLDGYRRFAAR